MEYTFDIMIAQKLGVNEAIIIRNIQFWIEKNKANNKHYYDGRYWTYNSISAFCQIFPFWTRDQIRYILKKLTEKEILISGSFNKNPYDKTLWYSLNDEKLAELQELESGEKLPDPSVEIPISNNQNSNLDVGNLPHREGENPKPIPDVNTYSKPDVNTHTHESACEKFSQKQNAGTSVNLPKCPVLPNSREVEEFCNDYKILKNSEFEPSDEDKIAIAEVLSKNGGYDARKREYWCDVFKKAARGWKIVEKDLVRIVPCSLDKVLKEHSRIKANELGLLPPKKDAPKPELPLEPEIFEDAGDIEEAREKARALFNDLRRLYTPIR